MLHSNLLELSSRKWDSCMRSIIFGSIRKSASTPGTLGLRSNASNMETRKTTRDQAWSVGGWSDTVQEVSQSLSKAIQHLKLAVSVDRR